MLQTSGHSTGLNSQNNEHKWLQGVTRTRELPSPLFASHRHLLAMVLPDGLAAPMALTHLDRLQNKPEVRIDVLVVPLSVTCAVIARDEKYPQSRCWRRVRTNTHGHELMDGIARRIEWSEVKTGVPHQGKGSVVGVCNRARLESKAVFDSKVCGNSLLFVVFQPFQ